MDVWNAEDLFVRAGIPATPEIALRELQMFDVPREVTEVVFRSGELRAWCPVFTGQPDFYKVEISLSANGRSFETKSLRRYLLSWLRVLIYAEQLAAKIARDLSFAAGGRVRVKLTQNIRGGIQIEANAEARPSSPMASPS